MTVNKRIEKQSYLIIPTMPTVGNWHILRDISHGEHTVNVKLWSVQNTVIITINKEI